MEQPPSSRLAFLFNRYAAGVCTEEEREEYLNLVKRDAYAHELQHLINEAVQSAETDQSLSQEERNNMLGAIMTPVITMQPRKGNKTIWWVAAAVLFLLGATVWLWLLRTQEPVIAKTTPEPHIKSDVQPGGNKAVLTLADNSTIILDSAANGKLAQQGNAQISKTNNGQLVYNSINEKPTEVLYNTLVTPRGGQYQLVLPDGSKVWLNAASSIRYPTAFAGNERKVEITGEAYFEVAGVRAGSGQKMPFVVNIGNEGGRVEVLGTHFNINAYEDEPQVKTTLLEGAVKFAKDAATAILKPGQQSQLSKKGALVVKDNSDVEETMAWKNGTLSFTHMDIETIMRQAARWYDVDVVYKDRIADTYTVSVQRSVPLSQLLRALEQSSGVHFIVEGKKITVVK